MLLAQSKVDSNGIFQFKISNISTQKLVVRSRRNWAYMYIQPNAEYYFEMPEKNQFEPKHAYGNEIELIFYNLDSLDINYKILSFQNFLDNKLSSFYYSKKNNPQKFRAQFVKMLDTINHIYKPDSTIFLRRYIKYTIAELEVVQNLRSREASYFKYFHNNSVYYNNDAYMAYFNVFYDYLHNSISNNSQTKIFNAIKRASPTLIMNILLKESFVRNLDLRELAMIKMMGDCYYNPEYSKQNVISILDSVSKRSRNKMNRKVALNLIDKLITLYPGQFAPEFDLINAQGDSVNLNKYHGKFVYFHFFNPNESQSISELEAMSKLHTDYGNLITFVTLYPKSNQEQEKSKLVLDKISWEKIPIDLNNKIWKKYRVKAFPVYYLINPSGILIQSPALSPVPNGDYETIHNSFVSIKKYLRGQ